MWKILILTSSSILLGTFVFFQYIYTFPKHTHQTEEDCLAKNIWYEARSESEKGWQVVIDVTLNRVASPRFPKSVCAVVYQYAQFSWTLEYQIAPVGRHWLKIKHFANNALKRPYHDTGELHYHATWMKKKPHWALKKSVSRIVGQHIVYLN